MNILEGTEYDSVHNNHSPYSLPLDSVWPQALSWNNFINKYDTI